MFKKVFSLYSAFCTQPAFYSQSAVCILQSVCILPVVSKTKHSNLENEAPKSRKRSTQNSKTKTPKSRKRSTLDRKRSTQISKTKTPKLENEAPESGGGSGCVRTSKGPQNPLQGFIRACQLFNWTFLDWIYCINFIIGLDILDTSYLNMHFFGTHTWLQILAYSSTREQ